MEIALVSKDKSLAPSFARSAEVKWVRKPDLAVARDSKRVFVFSTATELPEYSEFLHAAVKHKSLCALFVLEDIKSEWITHMLYRAGVRALKHVFVHKEHDLPKRVVAAWLADMQKQTIADAMVFDDRILVIGCDSKEYEIPFSSISALKRMPETERGDFDISEDGSYIHWPKSDVHLDIDSFKYVIDESYRENVDRKRLSMNKRYGEMIAQLRKDSGLRQSDVPGLSDRQVRRIEQGESMTSGAAEALAKAHNMSVNDYLSNLANLLHAR